jgi:hypothetical protein
MGPAPASASGDFPIYLLGSPCASPGTIHYLLFTIRNCFPPRSAIHVISSQRERRAVIALHQPDCVKFAPRRQDYETKDQAGLSKQDVGCG